MKRLNTQEREQIKLRYVNGESSGTLSDVFGVSDVAILNTLHRQGVQIRNHSEARRIYPVWDEAFSSPSPDGIYWIGFIMADGSILDESKIQVALAAKDLNHVIKLRKFLRTDNRPIYNVSSTNSVHLKIHSRQLVTDLASYGVVRYKTYLAEAMNNIDLEPAFWLGVMDGDGTIGVIKGRGRVRLCGTRRLMQQFIHFLEHHKVAGRSSGFKVALETQQNICVVTLLGRRAANFLTLAYGSSPVCLDRKANIARGIGLIH